MHKNTGSVGRRFFSMLCLVIAVLILLGWIGLTVIAAIGSGDIANDPAASGVDYLPIYLGYGFGSLVAAVTGMISSLLSALLAVQERMKILSYILLSIFVVGSYFAIMAFVL